jgi:ribosome-associated toxin RatA of RatAB toxin-antitoxin module
MMIHTISTKRLPYPSHEVWQAVTNFKKYSEWWPSTVRIKILQLEEGLCGSQIKVRPFGGHGFICKVVDFSKNTELRIKYSGIYSGSGVWTIAENRGGCQVTYEIKLDIDSLFIRWLSHILPIDKIHSRLMNKVLSGLEQHLGRLSAQNGDR